MTIDEALEQEPFEDCISRQAVDTLIDEDAEDYVMYVLQDADFERYSIFERIVGQ